MLTLVGSFRSKNVITLSNEMESCERLVCAVMGTGEFDRVFQRTEWLFIVNGFVLLG